MPTPSDTIENPAGTKLGSAKSVFPNSGSLNGAGDVEEEKYIQAQGSFVLDTSIESALLRSFIYGFFAKALEEPSEEHWEWLHCDKTLSLIETAARQLHRHPAFNAAFISGQEGMKDCDLERFGSDYISAFGHAARGRCPMNEIEYGDTQADPLFQPHRLADLAAFYRAFGLELTRDAAERQDHLCIELEFMAVLAAREAYACAHSDSEALGTALDAERKFLREHLGRWAVAFATRLASEAGGGMLGTIAGLLGAFIKDECALFAVAPGADVLALRPVNQADESLCASCGIHALPPGADPVSE